MRRARADRAALAVLLLTVAVGGTAGAQNRAAPAGTFGRGTLEGRAYRVWLPGRPAPERPLIVALHGCWQTPEDFALGTRLNEAAEARGLVVVYPAQTRAANPYRCWNWFDPTEQTATGREAAQILAIARRVQAERGLRDPRVVVIGFSAGAWMAVNLACAAPERRGRRRLGGRRALPLRRQLGGGDPVHARDGARRRARGDGVRDGQGCPAEPAGLALAGDRRQRGESGEPDRAGGDVRARPGRQRRPHTSTDHGAIRAVYRDRRGEPVLETWLVHGLGHAWSGGDPRARRPGRWGRRRPISCSTSSWDRASRAGPAPAGAGGPAGRRRAGRRRLSLSGPPGGEAGSSPIAEAGIVGGLADWFAVTAIFRRPLGLPIPHTALIPHNWERMAERVGVMVGGRVLTKDYVREEIARIDFSGLLARGAERVSRADLEAVTRTAARWLGEQLTPADRRRAARPRPACPRARAGGAAAGHDAAHRPTSGLGSADPRRRVLGAGRGDGAPGVPARGRRGDRRSARPLP